MKHAGCIDHCADWLLIGRTHLDLDREGVDEVLWDAVGVSGGVHAHRDELALLAGSTKDINTCIKT